MEVSRKLGNQKCKRLKKELNKALVTIGCMQNESAVDSHLSTRSFGNEENVWRAVAKILQECRMKRRKRFFLSAHESEGFQR